MLRARASVQDPDCHRPTDEAAGFMIHPLIVRHALAEARTRGLLLEGLIEGLTFDERDLLDPAFQLPYPVASEVVRRVVHATQEPDIGLILARRHHTLSWGLVGLGTLASVNLGLAMALGLRYQSEAGSMLALQLRIEHGELVLSASPLFADISIERVLVDITFATVLQAARTACAGIAPLRVELVSTQITRAESYQQVFQCPVHFSCLENRLVFDRAVSQRPIETADLATLRWVISTLDRERLQRRTQHRFRAAVEAEVCTYLHAHPTQADISELLGLTERTLRRRLQEEGCTHQDIVDQVRRSRALEWLCLAKRPADQVASLLGFSDVRGLSRAYRRWTGGNLSTTLGAS